MTGSANTIDPSESNGPTPTARLCVSTHACHASSIVPIAVTTGRVILKPCASNALEINKEPTHAPYTAPAIANEKKDPVSTRRDKSCPATAPASAPINVDVRKRCTAGCRNTREYGTGDMSTMVTSGASTASGPPLAPLRSPKKTTTAANIPSAAGPCCARSVYPEALIFSSDTSPERNNTVPPPAMAVM